MAYRYKIFEVVILTRYGHYADVCTVSNTERIIDLKEKYGLQV